MRHVPLVLVPTLCIALGFSTTGAASTAPAPTAAVRAAEAPMESTLTLHAEGIVVVDTDGSVADLQIATPLAADLKRVLESSLRKQRFKPVRIDGQPVRARAGFTVYLTGEREGDGFRVAYDGISFSAPKGEKVTRTEADAMDPTASRMTPPSYPKDLLLSRMMADVQLALLLRGDGTVEDVRVVRTTLIAARARGNEAQRVIRTFEKSAVAAARKWTVNVPAGYGARPPELRTAMTAVVYTIDFRGVDFFAAGQWVPVLRSARRPVDWLPPDQKRLAADMVGTGAGLMSPSSGLQMVEPLAGRPVM